MSSSWSSSNSASGYRLPRGMSSYKLNSYKLISSSYPVEWDYEGDEQFCRCNNGQMKAPRRTAWTPDNPSRRFYACGNYPGAGCKFYLWHDPNLSGWVREIILELMCREKFLLEEAKRRKVEMSRWKIAAEVQYAEITEENAALKRENENLKSEVMSFKMKMEEMQLLNRTKNKCSQCKKFVIILVTCFIAIYVCLLGQMGRHGSVLNALP